MNSGDIPSPVQDQLCICKHCGGQMTYAAEHAGMSSQCPHCQKEVVLGNALPTKTPSGIDALKNKYPKLMRYGSTAFWVILCGVLLYLKVSLDQNKRQKEAERQADALASPEKRDLINLKRDICKN